MCMTDVQSGILVCSIVVYLQGIDCCTLSTCHDNTACRRRAHTASVMYQLNVVCCTDRKLSPNGDLALTGKRSEQPNGHQRGDGGRPNPGQEQAVVNSGTADTSSSTSSLDSRVHVQHPFHARAALWKVQRYIFDLVHCFGGVEPDGCEARVVEAECICTVQHQPWAYSFSLPARKQLQAGLVAPNFKQSA